MLENVVKEGSGKSRVRRGLPHRGQDGNCAEVRERTHRAGANISRLLIGFSLEEEAPYAVLLTVDEPQGYMYYGSLVAAPAVGEIFSAVFALYGVEAEFTGEEKEVIGDPFVLGI